MSFGALRHFVFDLDGTLIDSGADLAAATNAALVANGLEGISREAVVGFIGDGTRELIARAVRASGGGPDDTGSVLEAFRAHYADHLLDNTRLHRGIRRVLKRCFAASVRLSVLTNKNEEFSRKILDGLGVAEFFSDLVGGDTLKTLKPDPSGLRELVGRAGVPRAETAIIGDSPVDIETGRRAEVLSVGVAWGLGEPGALLAAGARTVLSQPGDLLMLSGVESVPFGQ